MVALAVGQPEEPLLENRVFAVPEGPREAEVLLVIGRADEVGAKSVRNLPGVHVISADQLNTYDVLKADDVIFSVEALNAYIEHHGEQEVSH